MKWILAQVLGISFAGSNVAYLPVLSKVSVSHFYVASAPKIIAMFVYRCATFWVSDV